MHKHLLLPLVIFLAILQPIFSQDFAESVSDHETLAFQGGTSGHGIYKQPRWISWPAATFSFNALGFAETGPVAQLEINLYKGLYIVPSIRYNYLGYASNLLMTSHESDSKYSPGSFGAGLGIREFLGMQKKNRLVFVGLFGEYSVDKATYNIEDGNGRFESERIRQAISVVANVGYRWWFKKSFFLHMGIYGGISFELKDESRYLNGALKGDLEKDYQNNPFIGLIDLSFGWNF